MRIILLLCLFFIRKCVLGAHINPELNKSSKWMNEAIDPCDDFFSFTCGGFINSNEIPEGEKGITTFHHPLVGFTKHVESMLQAPIQGGDFEPLNNVKRYYRACRNTQNIEAASLNDMKEVIRKLGGWPVIDQNWNEDGYEWTKLHYAMAVIGLDVDALIDINVVEDYENKTINRIQVEIMDYGLENHVLRKGKENLEVMKYLKYMTEIAILFGADENVKDDMKNVLDLEIKLAEASVETDDFGNNTLFNNKYTISELQKQYPNIPWMEYLTKILMDTVVLENNEEIIVTQPKYIKMLNSLLVDIPKRVLANFQIWHMIQPLIFTLNEDAVKQRDNLYDVGAKINNESRSEHCISLIKEKLPALLGLVYVKQYADPESKAIAEEMVGLIITEFKNTVEGNSWMDESTKSVAVQKAKALKKLVSYSDHYNDTQIIKQLKNLNLNDSSFLYVNINITKFYNDLEYEDLRNMNAAYNNWLDLAGAIDLEIYDASKNTLVSASSLLHNEEHYFNKNQPMYMNFGRLGSKLASELMKNFFDGGRNIGVMQNFENWWTNASDNMLRQKSKCVNDQFEAYTQENNLTEFKTIQGRRSDYEDYITAGIAGHQQAYHAYKKWLNQHDNEEYRSNLTYKLEQYYWINVGQMFCYKGIETIWNALYKQYVFATIGNIEEFAKDWNCPEGSHMNPEPKCNVW